MEENQSADASFDTRNFNGNIAETIGILFNLTCFCETDLNTKITMKTPGRTYTKLRSFKFNFNYLFTLSSKRKEMDDKIKNNVKVWLDMEVPYGDDGDVELDYLRAGLKLFSMYGTELQRVGLITYKK